MQHWKGTTPLFQYKDFTMEQAYPGELASIAKLANLTFSRQDSPWIEVCTGLREWRKPHPFATSG